jgi:pimeloyl-ACP methyl ester carboxylesterase
MMKKHATIFILCLIILISGMTAIIQIFSLPLMNQEDQSQIKKDKTFFKLNSPQGPLDMHYIEKGSGSNHILFIHGFRAHAYTWQLLIDPLVQMGHHVWALDLIGFGLSDKPNNVIYNQNFFVNQIRAFMQDKQIASAHIVGNSMGGTLALELALNHPEITRSLTLINGLGYTLEMPSYLYIIRHLDFLWGPCLNPYIIRKCLYEVIYNKEYVTDEKVEAYCLPYRLPGGILASLLTMRQFDLQRLEELNLSFDKIKQPILIIWGEDDTLIPIDHYRRFVKDLPEAKNHLIPNCGHMPQEEKPDEVLSIIIPFYQTLGPSND